MIRPDRSRRSLNFDDQQIAVEFAVLHYTAADAAHSLEILLSPERKVSCHLLIDDQGKVFELVDCWEGKAKKAWHAGRSTLMLEGREWREFNDFSLGIELVNLNGNIYPYNERQYESLTQVLAHLKSEYPALASPHRVVGHEQIAGFRGKCDPGWMFDWQRLYAALYPGIGHPERKPVLSAELKAELDRLFTSIPGKEKSLSGYCSAVNAFLEQALRRS